MAVHSCVLNVTRQSMRNPSNYSTGTLDLNAQHIQQPTGSGQKNFISNDNAEVFDNNSGTDFPSRIQSVFARDNSSDSNDGLTPVEILRSSILSLLPLEAVTSASIFQDMSLRPAFPSSIHRSLIFSINNNFSGLEGVQSSAVLKFLANGTDAQLRLTKYLRAHPKFVSKAFAENLTRAAIEAGEATLVTALMGSGLVTPNEIIHNVDGKRYTAVERSSMLQSFEVTNALLTARADVNKTYSGYGALRLAICSRGESEPVDIRLVNLLLECGAAVGHDMLYYSLNSSKDPVLFRSLMSKYSQSQCHEYLRTNLELSGFLEKAMEVLDCESATLVVKQMLQACLQAGCGRCLTLSKDLHLSIGWAAMRGFAEIVTLLHENIPSPVLPLAAAVRGGHKAIIDLLLDRGAVVDSTASKLPGIGRVAFTPLSEAIRGRNNELKRAFEARGSLSNIHDERRFRAAIFAAAEVNDVDCAQRLLEMAPDVPMNAMDLALEISIEKGNEELALLLLRAGANVNAIMDENDDDQWSQKVDMAPLMALRQRNEILVRAIMDCNMIVRYPLSYMWDYDSPLLLAARWGNISIVRDLLQKGADVDADARIDIAADKEDHCHYDDNDDDNDDDGSGPQYRYHKHDFLRETAITAAIKRSNKLLAELLVVEYQASLNIFSERKTSPLAAAILNNDIDTFRYLLELGADPACHSSFKSAIRRGGEIFSELLRAFRVRYPMGKTGFGALPLWIAISRDDDRLLDALIEVKLDVNSLVARKTERINALGTAIRKHGLSNLKFIRKLIFAGADPDGIVLIENGNQFDWPALGETPGLNYETSTALLEAIKMKNRTLVELLVEAGADINRVARLGITRTPLQKACEVGSLEIVEFLLERGADINEQPAFKAGGTSLQLCAAAGYARIAETLLKHDANVHAPRPEMRGRTALEGAAENGRLDMLKILWNATNGQGFDTKQVDCAMKLARSNGHFGCYDLLQELRLADQIFLMPERIDLDHFLLPERCYDPGIAREHTVAKDSNGAISR